MTGGQLMRVRGGETVADSLFTDLRFGHGSDEFVIHDERASDRRKALCHSWSQIRIELNRLTPFRHTECQRAALP